MGLVPGTAHGTSLTLGAGGARNTRSPSVRGKMVNYTGLRSPSNREASPSAGRSGWPPRQIHCPAWPRRRAEGVVPPGWAFCSMSWIHGPRIWGQETATLHSAAGTGLWSNTSPSLPTTHILRRRKLRWCLLGGSAISRVRVPDWLQGQLRGPRHHSSTCLQEGQGPCHWPCPWPPVAFTNDDKLEQDTHMYTCRPWLIHPPPILLQLLSWLQPTTPRSSLLPPGLCPAILSDQHTLPAHSAWWTQTTFWVSIHSPWTPSHKQPQPTSPSPLPRDWHLSPSPLDNPQGGPHLCSLWPNRRPLIWWVGGGEEPHLPWTVGIILHLLSHTLPPTYNGSQDVTLSNVNWALTASPPEELSMRDATVSFVQVRKRKQKNKPTHQWLESLFPMSKQLLCANILLE